MCGRDTLTTPAADLAVLFDLDEVPLLEPRYNIAPTQPVAAVRVGNGSAARELTLLRWGLVPAWAEDPGIGNRLINARAETVADKPAFRSAFRQRRCLIPADGFLEWVSRDGRKQPYLFRLRNGGPFAFAGLWERWEGADGALVEACAILTTEANELVRPAHDRMPVILHPEDFGRWLDPGCQRADDLLPRLRPYPAATMIASPVSTRVNNPRHDDSGCLVPATPA